MLRHYRHRGLTTVGMMAGAVLLAATSLGTGLASAAGGDVRNSDLTSILALYRDGASGLGIPALFVTGTPPERSIGVGDANRDGHADLAVREDETDTLWMLQGNGAGGFGGPTILPAHERQKVLAIGDFNEDGLDDHAVAESLTGGARLLFGDGSGGFHTTSTPGTFPAGAVLVADLNEDGNRDLVVLDGKAGRVVVSLGNAEGRYGVERPVAVGMAPGAMATGDFNMDGSLDLAVAGSETLTILLGDGKGGFAAAREFPVGLRPASLAVSDFDGDGRADVVVADRRANHLSLLFGDGQGGFGTPLPIAEASWFSAEDTAVSDASEQGSGNKDAEARSSGSQAKSHADAYEGVASLTLIPTFVTGGTGITSFGTVTLNAPAPPGGVVVTLTSSNVELAATVPSITIPAGASQGTFTIATNAFYRRYSGLAFNVTISATHAATVSATLNVTAPPPPADFTSGSQAGSNTQWSGLMCGGIAPIGGNNEILYSCSPATGTGFGSCTFRQECAIGCRRVPPGGGTFNDFCATTGPNAVTVSRNYFVSGDHVPATVVTEAPVTIPTTAVPGALSLENNARSFSPNDVGGLHFPTNVGATSIPFDVTTSYVPSIEFVDVHGFWYDNDQPPFLILNGRGGHAWGAMLSVDPPPAQPIPTPVQFKIVGANPVTGGQGSLAQLHLSGIPHGIGPIIAFTSSHPAIVPAPASIIPAASNILGFDVPLATQPPAADTNVTLTATDGRYSFSAILTVLVPPPAPLLSGASVNPTSVVGGNSATVTVTLSAQQSSATVVRVSIIDTAPATLPANIPACSPPPPSRCTNVTVPAGATSASFTIATSAVTGQFNLNITADLPNVAGITNRDALLLITPVGAGPALATLTLNPTTVAAGNSSTGTVTLTAAAPSGGAVVSLSSSNFNTANVPGTVTVPVGATSAAFTVPTNAAVTASSTVTIFAGFGVVTRTADLTVTAVAAPPQPLLATLALNPTSLMGGNATTGTVTLSAAAPNGGAIVALSDNATAATVPTSVTVAAGATSATFTVTTASVTASTAATISGTLGATQSAALTINPPPTPAAPSLISPAKDATPAQPVTFDWSDVANTTSYEIQVDDSSTIAAPFVANQIVSASQVTIGSLPAQRLWWRVRAQNAAGVFGPFSSSVRFSPQTAPGAPSLSAVSVNPTSVVGGASSTGTVTLTSAAPTGGAVVSLSSNNGAATVPASVTVAAGATSATFTATTSTVTVSTAVTITGTFGGATRTATLTVNPAAAAPSLSAVTVNPTSVTGGSVSTGTVTLTSAAPTGGAVVSLSSNNGAATVPASVTVAAGATSATFTATTSTVTISTAVTITGAFGGATRTATLTVNPAGAAVTLTVTASGRSGERVTSSPAGINVTVGSTGAASFTSGTAITLSVTNGRDALWSGACSSGGNKTKTCTFTITGNASVTGNVQ